MREIIASEIAFVAEDDDGTPVGFALARRRAPGLRRRSPISTSRATRGAAESARSSCARCSAAFRELGIEHLDLDVLASNARRALAVRALGVQGRGRRS